MKRTDALLRQILATAYDIEGPGSSPKLEVELTSGGMIAVITGGTMACASTLSGALLALLGRMASEARATGGER